MGSRGHEWCVDVVGDRTRSRAEIAENTDLALRSQRTRRRNGTDHPPSRMTEKAKEGGRCHLFLCDLCALCVRSVFSATSARDPARTKNEYIPEYSVTPDTR